MDELLLPIVIFIALLMGGINACWEHEERLEKIKHGSIEPEKK